MKDDRTIAEDLALPTARGAGEGRGRVLTKWAVAVGLAPFLVGCAPQVALYRHPVTGEVRRCENWAAGGAMVVFGTASAIEGSKYANCKTAAEEAGYLRVEDK